MVAFKIIQVSPKGKTAPFVGRYLPAYNIVCVLGDRVNFLFNCSRHVS